MKERAPCQQPYHRVGPFDLATQTFKASGGCQPAGEFTIEKYRQADTCRSPISSNPFDGHCLQACSGTRIFNGSR